MQELLDVLLGERFLAFSNLLAVVFITIHLTCEFGHYIHEFVSRRKDAKKLTANNRLLTEMMTRIEKIEKTQEARGGHSCPLKKKMEEEDYVDDEVYVKTDRTL